MDTLEKARRVFDIECRALEKLSASLGDPFVRAVDLLLEALANRGKIVVMGVGKSGHIGDKIAATLTSTGSTAVVLNALNALHGDLGIVNDGDVILALSYSGETDELTNVLPAFSRFAVKIISMTGNPASLLARSSHVTLDVSVEEEACPLRLAPTTSTTAMLVLGDALAMVLLEARGFRKEDFAKFHPGGSLGRSLLLKVSDIMRGPEHMATVQPGSDVRQTLRRMTTHRAGAAVILAEDGALAGIFTHGDFARHFQDNPGLGSEPVEKFMTRNPVTIRGDKLAAEVLHVLESHRIDDLVVVDADNRPLGVVDSQDLTRFKLI